MLLAAAITAVSWRGRLAAHRRPNDIANMLQQGGCKNRAFKEVAWGPHFIRGLGRARLRFAGLLERVTRSYESMFFAKEGPHLPYRLEPPSSLSELSSLGFSAGGHSIAPDAADSMPEERGLMPATEACRSGTDASCPLASASAPSPTTRYPS